MGEWEPIPLNCEGNKKTVICRKPFTPSISAKTDSLNKAFNFAYDIAYSNKHRNHRTDGSHRRRPTEIFVNAFIGKLCEFALYDYFKMKEIKVNEPDLNIYARGKWDSADLVAGEYQITIKSTKSNGNLLLLEERDWDLNACYLPSEAEYDFFILVRTDYDLERKLRKQKMLYTDSIERSALIDLCNSAMGNKNVQFDIPGWLSKGDIIKVIEEKQLIFKGDLLNGYTKMDATNYYVQASNMRSIGTLISWLKFKTRNT